MMFNIFNGNLTNCELFILPSKFLKEETTSYLINLRLSLHILIYAHERSPTSIICKSTLGARDFFRYSPVNNYHLFNGREGNSMFCDPKTGDDSRGTADGNIAG